MSEHPRRSCRTHLAWASLCAFAMSFGGMQAQAPNPDVKATLTDNTPAATKKNPGDPINYAITVTNASTSTANANSPVVTLPTPAGTTIVAGSVNMSPLVFDESYSLPPNTRLTIHFSAGLTWNDFDDGGQIAPVNVSRVGGTGTANTIQGTLTNVDANGGFIYTPGVGATGTETFQYFLQEPGGIQSVSAGFVTFILTGPRIWYVQAGAAAGGTGRSHEPFNTPEAASTAANQPTDIIYVLASGTALNGAFTLEDSQELRGQGVALTMPTGAPAFAFPPGQTFTHFPAATPPVLTNTTAGGNIVNLTTSAGTKTVTAVTLGNRSGSAVAGSGFGTLAVGTLVTTSGTGALLNLATGALSGTFDTLATTSAGTCIGLTGITGTLAATTVNISGVTADLFNINGGTVTLNLPSTYTFSGTTGRSLNISNRSGAAGNLTINNKILNTGAGILLDNNDGATITLRCLNLSTGSNLAFSAVNGGTVVVTNGLTDGIDNDGINGTDDAGEANTITTTTATALNVVGTTSGGLTFQSISAGTAASGPVNAIVLNNTGSGGLTVTGNSSGNLGGVVAINASYDPATAGSMPYAFTAPSLADNTGGLIQRTTGDAIVLTNTANVSFTRMRLTNIGTAGNQADGAQAIAATNLGGSNFFRFGHITNTGQGGGADRNGIDIRNTNTNMTLFSVENSYFANADSGTSYILAFAMGTSSMRLDVKDSMFEDMVPLAVQASAGNTEDTAHTQTTNITGNVFRNASIADGQGGIAVTNAEQGVTHNFVVSNNVFHDLIKGIAGGNSELLATQVTGGVLAGTISGNVVGGPDVSGISGANGDRRGIGIVAEPDVTANGELGSFDIIIENNKVDRLVGREGIFVDVREDTQNSELIIRNNRIGTLNGFLGQVGGNGATDREAVDVQHRGDTDKILNMLMTGNTIRSTTTFPTGNVNIETNNDSGFAATVLAFHATVTSNTIINTGGMPEITFRTRTGDTGGTVNLDMSGNTLDGGAGQIALGEEGGPVNVEQASQAALATANSIPSGNVLITGTPQFNVANLPPPAGLLFSPAEVENFGLGTPDSSESAVAWTEKVRSQKSEVGSQKSEVRGQSSRGQRSEVGELPRIGTLTQAELDGVVAAARARWVATGLSEEQVKALDGLTFEVTDLAGWHLGEAQGSMIRVDSNAGGNGWFVDATPERDEEFTVAESSRFGVQGSRLSANIEHRTSNIEHSTRDGEQQLAGVERSMLNVESSMFAADRIDLLTTVLHEMGHTIGLCDSYSKLARNSVMYGFLTKGERRLPRMGEADGAVPHVHSTPHYLDTPIGLPAGYNNLPPGKGFRIYYQVTINNPLTAAPIVSQGTVSGGNFTTVNGISTSLPNTDDVVLDTDPPAGAVDPTVTLIERPDTTVVTLNRTSANPNNTTSMNWSIVFAAPVRGVTASNFAVVQAGGVSGSTIGTPVATSAETPAGSGYFTTWTIPVTGVAGNGTLGLNLANDTGMLHDITNPGFPPFVGQVYTNDKLPPVTNSFARLTPPAQDTNADTLVFRVTFNEDVLNVNAADFAVTGTTATVTGVAPQSASVYDVTVSGGNLAGLNGTVGLNFAATIDITDLATNALPTTEPAIDQTYNVDNTQPTVAMNSATGDPAVNAPIPVIVQFSEVVLNFIAGDIVPTNGTVQNFLVVDGDTYTFNLVPTGPGVTVTANIAADVANDAAGNLNTAAPTFSRTIVDAVSIVATTPTAVEGGATGLYTLTRGNTTASMVANFQLDVSSTAIAGTDFTLSSSAAMTFNPVTGAGTITFANGQGTVSVTLTALQEAAVNGGQSAEPAETARLNVVAGTGYIASPPTDNATVTITADGLVVTNTNDAGAGSLRQALANGVALSGATVVFSNTSVGGVTNFFDATPDEILLTSGQIVATGTDLRVQGPGAQLLTVRNATVITRAFLIPGPGSVTISGLTVTGLQSAIRVDGTLTLRACTVSGSRGPKAGGIEAETGSRLRVINCTISGNTASVGSDNRAGGIYSDGSSLEIINSTISGNVVEIGGVDHAGGVFTDTPGTAIINSTITDNRVAATGGGWGVYVSATSSTVQNSIIAGNLHVSSVRDTFGNMTSNGGNVIGAPVSAAVFTQPSDLAGSLAAPVDPLVGPLTLANGGTTATHALLPGSPALNRGLPGNLPQDTYDVDGNGNVTEVLPVDQRGVGFNRSIGNPDAGAFELQKSVGIIALDATKAEGTGAGTTAFTFTVSRTGDTTGPVTMNYAVTGTGAAPGNGTDFQGGTLPSGSVTIADTLASTTLTIQVAQDATVEPNEEFTVTLSNPDNGYVVNGGTATGTINNDDATTVTLTGGGSANEGAAATTNGRTLTATLSNPVQGGFTIGYVTNNGTALTADSDYVDNDGTLTFAGTAGETQTFTVTVNGDNKVELDETFTTSLGAIGSTTLGASITPGGSPQTGTITNDDSAVVALAGSVSQSEATTPQAFSVTLSNPVDVAVTVQFSTTGVSATAGTDYTEKSGEVVTFPAGSTTAQTVNVTVANDTENEIDEVFNVSLGTLGSSGRNVSLGTSAGTGTIVNDDALTVNITALAANADENTPGVGGEGTFVISRNSVLGSTTVQLQIDSGSTAGDADYALSGGSETFANEASNALGSVIIPAGQTSVTVTLTPVDDVPAEAAETSRLNIQTNAAYVIGSNANATVTIIANDVVVVNTNDGGEGSLRQAAANASVFPGADTVTFEGTVFTDATVPDVISLNDQISVGGLSTTIEGPGAKLLTVRNGVVTPTATSRVFNISGGAFDAVLRGMTIREGNPNSDGGGGVLVNAGGTSVTIDQCVITNNSPQGRGAGLRVINGGSAEVKNSTISNNTVTGGTNCGAGIDAAGTLTVTNSTISGNVVATGGAAVVNGGGVYSSGATTATTLNNCTITNNNAAGPSSAGGVHQASGTVTAISCLIAKNNVTAGLNLRDVGGTFTTSTSNLIGDNTGSNFIAGAPHAPSGNYVGTSAARIDPLIAALADNGGPTPTHMLQTNSPALDHGSNSLALLVDQRGLGFPRQIGVNIDIGAVEALIHTPVVTDATTNEDEKNLLGLVITRNTADDNTTTHFKITNILNGKVYKNDGTTEITNGTFLTLVEGGAGLKFLPSPNLNSVNTPAGFHFSVQASVDGADTGLKPEIAVANITVTAVNDPPTVVLPGIPDQSIVVSQSINVNLLPHFQDVDVETLTFTLVSALPAGQITAGINANLTSVDITGLSVGTVDVKIEAKDGSNATVQDTFKVNVGIPKPSSAITVNKVFRPQTGLFELQVEVTNDTAVDLFGFRLRVTNLPTSLKLYNATSPPGSPDVFADHAYPLKIGEKVTMVLLFYSPTRTWPAGYVPAISVEGLTAGMSTSTTATGVRITRVVEQPDGSILLEWPAVVGRWYRVKFSDDNANWKFSLVPIRAGSTRVQWIDKGPPFTDVHPGTVAQRFYLVEQIVP